MTTAGSNESSMNECVQDVDIYDPGSRHACGADTFFSWVVFRGSRDSASRKAVKDRSPNSEVLLFRLLFTLADPELLETGARLN
jgi:hypothetical protein